MTDREKIMGAVKAALDPLKERAALPEWDTEFAVLRRARETVEPWALLAERLRLVNGMPVTTGAELVAMLEKNGWRHGYCDPGLWEEVKGDFPAGFTVETVFERARVDEYQFGITLAAGAVAETGTVILEDGKTSSRLAALAPWVHVAVVRPETIFVDLQEAVAAMGKDSNIIWCTGPSKTADVEGILIEGVHGPGVQVVWRK